MGKIRIVRAVFIFFLPLICMIYCYTAGLWIPLIIIFWLFLVSKNWLQGGGPISTPFRPQFLEKVLIGLITLCCISIKVYQKIQIHISKTNLAASSSRTERRLKEKKMLNLVISNRVPISDRYYL